MFRQFQNQEAALQFDKSSGTEWRWNVPDPGPIYHSVCQICIVSLCPNNKTMLQIEWKCGHAKGSGLGEPKRRGASKRFKSSDEPLRMGEIRY